MPTIKVPDELAASNLKNCSIVHIKYEITVCIQHQLFLIEVD